MAPRVRIFEKMAKGYIRMKKHRMNLRAQITAMAQQATLYIDKTLRLD
jgi:hypothetical protein